MFGLKYNHHTVVSGNVYPTTGQDYNGLGVLPRLGPRQQGDSQGLPSFRLTHWPWACNVSWEGSVRMASRDRSSPHSLGFPTHDSCFWIHTTHPLCCLPLKRQSEQSSSFNSVADVIFPKGCLAQA